VAAVGSYLDARAHEGEWLVRIEDLDPPRERPGMADQILRSLDQLGLHPDGPVLRQSSRSAAYDEALARLETLGLTRTCACSRSALAALPENRDRSPGEELFHPATCLEPLVNAAPGTAIRCRAPDREIEFMDRSLGVCRINPAHAGGDFVLRRRDGQFAYQLAVVVDDAAQGITDVVRGADLLASTPRQRLLQEALGLPQPRYLHLPLAVDERGLKLSKSEDAPAVGLSAPAASIVAALEFLEQEPPADLARAGVDEVLQWGVAHWRPERFAGSAARRVRGPAARCVNQEPTR
jgi:glutamyl-Q tRNA(Asp) synthetase